MNGILKAAVAAALIVGAAGTANAATIVVNHVYDPANLVLGSLTGEALLSPVTLQAGDTLDLTITFTGGATITGNGEDGIWSLLLTENGPSATLATSGTLELLGASANVVSGPVALSQGNAFIHLGSYYTSGNYRLDSAPITFTGLRQIITIDSDNIGTAREYQKITVTYFSGSLGAGAVPEPATWALMIGGFGMVGAAARRRRLMPLSA